ncbi:MAG: hypothetical protein HY245_04710 [Rhizobiales bacterium]|nr:hypothetical protein [Hyphomicrobiales bacterium]MBI3672715.1 hypothetical protein [Hyphomicrobiales bacterium]
MIRYSVLLLAGLLSIAIAATGPQGVATLSRNLTVITKSEAFPVLGPIVVGPCRSEDCAEG